MQLESGVSSTEAVGVRTTQRRERLEQVALAAGDQEGRLKQAISDVKQLIQRLQTNLRALKAAVAQLEQAHDTVEQWGGDAWPAAQQQATELIELRERYEDLESRYDKLVAMQERKEASGGEQVKGFLFFVSWNMQSRGSSYTVQSTDTQNIYLALRSDYEDLQNEKLRLEADLEHCLMRQDSSTGANGSQLEELHTYKTRVSSLEAQVKEREENNLLLNQRLHETERRATVAEEEQNSLHRQLEMAMVKAAENSAGVALVAEYESAMNLLQQQLEEREQQCADLRDQLANHINSGSSSPEAAVCDSSLIETQQGIINLCVWSQPVS